MNRVAKIATPKNFEASAVSSSLPPNFQCTSEAIGALAIQVFISAVIRFAA